MNTSRLIIDVPPNVDLGSHTIDILGNATFPQEQISIPLSIPSSKPINFKSTDYTLKLPLFVKSENTTRLSSLTVNVQTPWEQGLELLNKWQFPITFVSGIIIGNVAPWIFKKISNRNIDKGTKDHNNIQPTR